MSGQHHADSRAGVSAGSAHPCELVGRSLGPAGELLRGRARHRRLRLLASRHARDLQHWKSRQSWNGAAQHSVGAWLREKHSAGRWNARCESLRRRRDFQLHADGPDARRTHQARPRRTGVCHGRRCPAGGERSDVQPEFSAGDFVGVTHDRRRRCPCPPILHRRLLPERRAEVRRPLHAERSPVEGHADRGRASRSVSHDFQRAGGQQARSIERARFSKVSAFPSSAMSFIFRATPRSCA